jgi:hypothetical protein
MKRKSLSFKDIQRIKRINLFRLKKDAFIIIYGSAILLFLYSFAFPYLGWRRKPVYIPSNFSEYVYQAIQFHYFLTPYYLIAIGNILIKKIEIYTNKKYISIEKVIFKKRILNRLSIIIFSPLHILLFKNKFRYNEISKDDKVKLEKTIFGRILNYEKNNI